MLSNVRFLGLQKWPDETQEKGKAINVRGAAVAAVPGRKATGLGTQQNPRQPRLDSARSSRATSSIMEDITLPTPWESPRKKSNSMLVSSMAKTLPMRFATKWPWCYGHHNTLMLLSIDIRSGRGTAEGNRPTFWLHSKINSKDSKPTQMQILLKLLLPQMTLRTWSTRWGRRYPTSWCRKRWWSTPTRWRLTVCGLLHLRNTMDRCICSS